MSRSARAPRRQRGGPAKTDVTASDNFFQKTIEILHAAAVAVRSVVRLSTGGKQFDEVAVGRVNLHAVGTPPPGSLGGSPVVVHNPWNQERYQRPGVLRGAACRAGVWMYRSFDRDGRGGDAELAVVEAVWEARPVCQS